MLQFRSKASPNEENKSRPQKAPLKTLFNPPSEDNYLTTQYDSPANRPSILGNNNAFQSYRRTNKSTSERAKTLDKNRFHNKIMEGVSRNQNIEGVQQGGLFSERQCAQLAKSIICAYDGNGKGYCQTLQVAKWLVDCYRAMNKAFQPTATDIACFMYVVDRNRTGKVTVDDLENFLARIFFNPNKSA